MSEEKKIIIDEDWKSQVEAEKEAFAKQPPEEDGHQSALPAASFEMLVTSFATEAMMALGQIPHPVTQQVAFDRDHAKYAIDTLGVLQAKTKGNLSKEEDAMLEGILYQLRMAFVAITTGAAPTGNAGSESSGETPTGKQPVEGDDFIIRPSE